MLHFIMNYVSLFLSLFFFNSFFTQLFYSFFALLLLLFPLPHQIISIYFSSWKIPKQFEHPNLSNGICAFLYLCVCVCVHTHLLIWSEGKLLKVTINSLHSYYHHWLIATASSFKGIGFKLHLLGNKTIKTIDDQRS